MGRLPLLTIALVLLASACGGSGTDSSTTEPTTQVSEPATSPGLPSTTLASEAAQTVDAPELGGTSWNVTTYRLPSGSMTNVWKTEVTISFAADGTLSGSTGCNDYDGTWMVTGTYDEFESGVPDTNDGQVLIIDSLSQSAVGCNDEAIMEQEGEIFDLLQRGGRWVLIRDNFHLRDSEGAFLFEAESG